MSDNRKRLLSTDRIKIDIDMIHAISAYADKDEFFAYEISVHPLLRGYKHSVVTHSLMRLVERKALESHKVRRESSILRLYRINTYKLTSFLKTEKKLEGEFEELVELRKSKVESKHYGG